MAEALPSTRAGRRARRKSGTARRWGKWLAIGMLALVFTSLIVGYLAARAYLHSEGFRLFLGKKVSAAAGVQGNFQPFRWHGLAVDSGGFSASGENRIRAIELGGLHAEIDLGALRRSAWHIERSEIRTLAVAIDTTRPVAERTVTPENLPPAAPGKKAPGWLPQKVEFSGLDVRDFNVAAATSQGLVNLKNAVLKAKPGQAADSWLVELTGGNLALPFPRLREARLERADLRHESGVVFLNHASAGLWTDARAEISGEWNTTTRERSFGGNLRGARLEEALPPHWARRISGTAETDFSIHGSAGNQTIKGHAEIRDGTLTALPALDALAAYLDTARFRTIRLSEARADWRREGDHWTFENIVLAGEGLLRIEGTLASTSGNLAGNFRLGLSPAVLGKIPGAESHVFLPGPAGLSWTTVNISGTPDDLREDLTERLIAAAGMRMIEEIPETGEKVLRFSREVLSEKHQRKLGQAIGKGVEFLNDHQDVIEDARSVLDHFLK